MATTNRRIIAVALFIAFPLLAQDKDAGKKSDAKEAVEKKVEPKDENKAESKKPLPTTPTKYQSIGKIAGKLLKLDGEEMTIEMEVVVPTKRSAKLVKQTHTMADDFKVRWFHLPEKLDVAGKANPNTAKEKAERRGDNPKVPGYSAEFKDLKVGQLIEIELSVKKPPVGMSKKKNEDPDPPVVTMIVIAKEAPKTPEKKK